MKKRFNRIGAVLLAITIVMGASSCKKDNDTSIDDKFDGDKTGEFHLAFAVGSDSESATYVQGVSDLTSGSISFNNFGFQMPSTRTARFYSSNDGAYVYNLDYGGGSIYRYKYNSKQDYTKTHQTDVSVAMGTANPRWTKINDDYALLHNVVSTNYYTDVANTIFKERLTKAILTVVDLSDVSIVENTEFNIPLSPAMIAANYFVSRIDAPIVQNGKAYYGVALSKYDPITNTSAANYINTVTLVVDFPSLANPKIIETTLAKGATNGYRTPNAHIDEAGDIYVISDDGSQSTFLKIKDGVYQNYTFDFSAAIGRETSTQGWFYAGGGIAYVPYLKADLGAKSSANWGVARVDLYNKTVVDLEVPASLWLQQYQYSVVKDGKFYMALSPVGGAGHIYIFDVKSASTKGYTLGASITSGADAYYIGIF